MKRKTIKNPPKAKRTITSLRDTGYSAETAIADIIDNSIEAEAATIEVILKEDITGDLILYCIDDGYGMDEKGIINALTLGSDEKDGANRLGKFGMGLKTASLSCCKHISVISRKEGSINAIKGILDLELLEDDFEITLCDPDQTEIDTLNEHTKGGGTIIKWSKIDRILKKDYKRESAEAKALKKLHENIKDHLSLVFDKFLDKTEGGCDIEIKYNDEILEGWSPFLEDEKSTIKKPMITLEVDVREEDGKIHEYEITIKPYILPRPVLIEDNNIKKKANIDNPSQGFYVYRNHRLIQTATLFTLKKEQHMQLFRAEINMPEGLDEFAELDIKKSRYKLDKRLTDDILKEVVHIRKEAEQIYRGNTAKKHKKKSENIHKESNTVINEKVGGLTNVIIDSKKGKKDQAEVSNDSGKNIIGIKNPQQQSLDLINVNPVESTQGDCLWEPATINDSKTVNINITHPFYEKMYIANENQNIRNGLDYLMFSLVLAELANTNPDLEKTYRDFRYFSSKSLRDLIETLPDAIDDGNLS